MSKKRQLMTYASSGVRYDLLDGLKRKAQALGRTTAKSLKAFAGREVSESRGESAYVWEEKDRFSALVIEGLGTKNLVADAMEELTGKTYYHAIAQDTVAMIVNDLIIVGALPMVVNAYFAVGSSDWFKNAKRAGALVKGWADACALAGAAWGGGETPTLTNVIDPATIDLAGSAFGVIKPKKRLTLGDKIAVGDAIVFVESSGIHANGLTMARKIADRLPKGYNTKLSDGSTFGDSLLTPTHIYARLVREVFNARVDIHYMVHITGHGWRKLMRAEKNVSCVIETIPNEKPIFAFIKEHSNTSDEEMFGNFNMGAGFTFYVARKDVVHVIHAAKTCHLKAWEAGYVAKGPKRVVIRPKDIVFSADTLSIR